jgi:chloramphenicol O-acetyltransferase type A
VEPHFLDLDTWPRRQLFAAYHGTDFPYIFLTADVDVTRLRRYTRAAGLSFNLALVFAANTIANRIENFRYRFTAGRPFRLDSIRAVFTHLPPGSDLFVLVACDSAATLADFCRRNRAKARQPVADHGFASVRGHLDLIVYSALPWVRYTQFIRPVTHNGEDCNPKISWGKIEERGERLLLPFSLQVHHGLMDGYHLGLYLQQLQHYLDHEEWR